jgi:signal transduction histidine kinase
VKSSVIASVPRDLRLSLYEIIAATDILCEAYREKDLSALKNQLSVLTSKTTEFACTVSNIIELKKMETQPSHFFYEQFDIVPLLREVSHSARLIIGSRPVIIMDVPSPDPISIISDQAKIRQIVRCIMSNAAKFTYRGRIALILNRGKNWIRLTVTDTGIGMTSEQIKTFDPSADHFTDSANYESLTTGRGLKLVHKLVSLLSGSISISSKLGEGTIVEVMLPTERPENHTNSEDIISQEICKPANRST